MNNRRDVRWSDQQLASRLREKFQTARAPDAEREHEDLELLAKAVSKSATDQERVRALDLIANDQVAAEAVLSLGALVVEPAPPASARRRRILWLGVAAVAAAAAIAFVFMSPHDRGSFVEPSSLSPKGENDALAVAVDRAGRRFRLNPGESVHTGDKLGFFYSSTQPGHLTLFTRDNDGQAVLVAPSEKIEPGENVPLSTGVVAEEGGGCEWIVAIFSEAPIAVEDVASQIAGAKSTPACDLHVQLDRVRAVRVFPIARER